jgi:hypothetical protein
MRESKRHGATGMRSSAWSWLRRLFGRREPTTYQRFLAVHIHYADPRSALN